jgi:adenylate cyclase
LRKFQSPRLVEHLVEHPRFLEQPVHQDVAVVFIDLSGFTGLAEAIGPEWARNLLSGFQALVERDVVAHDGFVVSFMGDGVMTVFGVPECNPDDASRAFLTILQLRESIATWLFGLPPVARDRLQVRIGGHCGPVVVSLLGPPHHQHVTATGDTVNVTSRLLEVAKQLGCSVVVSEELWVAGDAAALFAGPTDPAREVAIRGRKQPIRVRALH